MDWSTVISLTSLFCTGVTAVFSVLAYAKVVGFENSTHQLQYVPVPGQDNYPTNPDAQTGPELMKGFAGDNMQFKQPE